MPCPGPPRRQGRSPRGVPFPAMGKEPKDRQGTFRKVPRGPSSRPRGKPRGGFPHWIPLPGTKGRNREARGKAEALTGRGGAIERMQAFAAIAVTADAQPVRFATTKVPFGAVSFPDFFLAGKKKSGRRRLTCETSAETIYDSAPAGPLAAGRSFPRDGKGTKGSPGAPSERFPGDPPPGQRGNLRVPPLDSLSEGMKDGGRGEMSEPNASSFCHCEERSDVAIRFPLSSCPAHTKPCIMRRGGEAYVSHTRRA